jgi:hypothetical protein
MGDVTRKIELARQLEEMRVLHSAQQTDLPSNARKLGLRPSVVAERLQRQAAIIKTLEWNQEHEAEIRAWAAAQKAQ